MRDILSEEILLEGVVPRRNRRMSGEKGRRSDDFYSLIKSKMVVFNKFPDPFEANECRMAFVAVIQIGFYSQFIQGTDSADSKNKFLLQPVFMVASI